MSRFMARTPVGSAPVARARLQDLLEYDRSLISHADLLSVLREEILALIGRHPVIDTNKVQFMVARGDTASTLTVDVEVPFLVRPTGARYARDAENALSYP